MNLALQPEPFESPDVQLLIEMQVREMRSRYTIPGAPAPRATDFVEPSGVFLVGREDGVPVACGGIRALEGRTGEIRRMFTLESHRRRGHGRALLAELEVNARRLGYDALRLETGYNQPDAVGLYSACGYGFIPAYGEFNDADSICMEKRLAP